MKPDISDTVRITMLEIGQLVLNNGDPDLLLYGSAGSGKSWLAAQKVIIWALQYPDLPVLVCRKYMPSLRITCMELIRTLLNKYKIPYKENRSEATITFRNGSRIYFRPLHAERKGEELTRIRSVNVGLAWIEEAVEITRSDYLEVKRRIREYRGQPGLQCIFTFNPDVKTHWIYQYFWLGNRGTKIHMHYTLNPFLPDEFIRELENLKEVDEQLYKRFTKGEWGETTGQIYQNWRIVDKLPDLRDLDLDIGVDFGWENPSVALLIGRKERKMYIIDEIYQRYLTTDEFAQKIKDMIERWQVPRNITVYCDPSSPGSIQELYNHGLNAKPAERRQVMEGIRLCQGYKIYIYDRCENFKKEIRNYKFEQDKEGNIIEKPVKAFDHAMDAMRYVVQSTGLHSLKPASSSIEDEEFLDYE